MSETVIGLVDVRSMFVSCERALDPRLEERPVIVLSNNDGCAVARSQEAKDLGIAMGQPWFEITRNSRWHNVIGCSSNYELYGDMAARMVSTLRTLVADLEVYSIDECFVTLPARHAQDLACTIQARMRQWTGLPVAIGVGTTKTLAKQAQHMAKADPATGGICDLTTWAPRAVDEAFKATPVSDVWGVGSRLTAALAKIGIRTVLDLARADPGMIRRRHSIVLERTVRELAGTPCIPLGHEPRPRRQVMYSRMLGQPVTTRTEMSHVLTHYATQAARRLRQHTLQAALMTVTMSTSRFRAQAWHHTWPVALSPATAEPIDIIRAAQQALPAMVEGRPYNRAGILLETLSPAGSTPSLLPRHGTADPRVSTTVDQIQERYGRHAIGYGTTGLRAHPRWEMRRNMLSPAATTRWDQLLTAHTF